MIHYTCQEHTTRKDGNFQMDLQKLESVPQMGGSTVEAALELMKKPQMTSTYLMGQVWNTLDEDEWKQCKALLKMFRQRIFSESVEQEPCVYLCMAVVISITSVGRTFLALKLHGDQLPLHPFDTDQLVGELDRMNRRKWIQKWLRVIPIRFDYMFTSVGVLSMIISRFLYWKSSSHWRETEIFLRLSVEVSNVLQGDAAESGLNLRRLKRIMED